jgi:hypothetical protein
MATFNKFQFLTSWFDTKEQNAAFDFQTVCVCSMFTRIMRRKKLSLLSGMGVVVEYGPNKRDGYIYGPTPFITVESTKDIRPFFSLADFDKRRYTASLIQEGLASVAAHIGDDAARFEPVLLEMQESGYINRFLWASKWKKDRSMRADVFVEYLLEEIEVTATVTARDGNLISERVISRISPNEYALDKLLGKIDFDTDGIPLLISKSGQILRMIANA